MIFPDCRADLALRDGYHSPQVDVAVRLNTNESPYPPPEGWRRDLASAIENVEFNRYPDRAATRLREALAGLHQVRPDQVFVANGSNEVLQSICLAYGGPGRRAAVYEPTYALHSHIAHLSSTEVVQGTRRDDFSVDVDQVADVTAAARPDITFLCSPNNPTGNALPAVSAAEILELSPGLVVLDEAYGDFADWSAISMVDDEVPLVVTRTFSKTWSMAALRLGYLIGPARVVASLERVALPYHLDALKQIAGRLAVAYGDEMRRRVAAIVSERRRLQGALENLDVDVWPSEANFLLFRPKSRKGDEVWHGLVDRGVLVRNTSNWPSLPAGCLRVTVGTGTENDAFLSALKETL